MSAKAIIILPLVDRRTPPMGRFLRSDKHENHIWDGREFDLSDEAGVNEFNSHLGPALSAYDGRTPRPKPVLFFEANAEDDEPEDESSPEAESSPIPRKRRAYRKRELVPTS